MAFPHLFTPGRIGTLEVPNRFVQGSVQTRCADADGYVKQELIDYHRARSRDGKGPRRSGFGHQKRRITGHPPARRIRFPSGRGGNGTLSRGWIMEHETPPRNFP